MYVWIDGWMDVSVCIFIRCLRQRKGEGRGAGEGDLVSAGLYPFFLQLFMSFLYIFIRLYLCAFCFLVVVSCDLVIFLPYDVRRCKVMGISLCLCSFPTFRF
ncbi:hypothetical protein, unlikely [Trypanosoma brucei gambiense DAL972]|uniref:Uncharacterized protein n=1 Tax=Trypanosoma brucei gambiense (strain MHOM/CI/86/DAL972) TaxID=679716 RepID=C9ZUP5_TRYB9|nr:hypothetical protein, unlikely [Trypanosoma brucei gambiense DAL972]CBH13133.1 hypothetical protein, unlikely [Trypanosoma brucei gambiense DAL972]|eukprot:XP_011775410.1 hypothetical protein, unlikely [Trypanosoma brucei gambiense DAL972]